MHNYPEPDDQLKQNTSHNVAHFERLNFIRRMARIFSSAGAHGAKQAPSHFKPLDQYRPRSPTHEISMGNAAAEYNKTKESFRSAQILS